MTGFSFSMVCSSYYSSEQYTAISKTTVGIAGAGGLGSNCAVNLVRSGFSKFVIADFDVVELSNLNRQAYLPEHIGQPKVESLKGQLLKINPECTINAVQVRLNETNARGFFSECEVVVEAFDSSRNKAMLVNLFLGSEKLIVSASGLGGFGNSDRIVTRKIRENFYLVGDGTSGVDSNVRPLAPCVGIAAAKEADIVLSWVLEKVNKK
jgi:sulfur carrier protein ThiS adenylyltransferase